MEIVHKNVRKKGRTDHHHRPFFSMWTCYSRESISILVGSGAHFCKYLVVGSVTNFMLNNVPIQSLHTTHNSKMNSKMKGNLVILINATVFLIRVSAVWELVMDWALNYQARVNPKPWKSSSSRARVHHYVRLWDLLEQRCHLWCTHLLVIFDDVMSWEEGSRIWSKMMGWGQVDQNCLKAFFDLSGLLWEEVYTRSLKSSISLFLGPPETEINEATMLIMIFWFTFSKVMTINV